MMTMNRLWTFLLLAPIVWTATVLIVSQTSLSARIYNVFILQMTSAWYRAVLEGIAPHSTVLDVGIGTAGALLLNQDVIRNKHLHIYGVDVSKPYVKEAQRQVLKQEMQDQVQVARHSIYDVPSIQDWLKEIQGRVDVVYFSGSFSLLPDPQEALVAAQHLLQPNGTIYITQTYASSISRLGQVTKPLIRYLTSIDFGQLVSNEQVMQVFEKSNMTLVSHEQLKQSNAFGLSPPAFVTTLRMPSKEEATCVEGGNEDSCSRQ